MKADSCRKLEYFNFLHKVNFKTTMADLDLKLDFLLPAMN